MLLLCKAGMLQAAEASSQTKLTSLSIVSTKKMIDLVLAMLNRENVS